MKITVKDGDKTLVGLTHVVTESEMENLVAVVDIYLSGLSANIKPESLVGDGKYKATITVTVTDSAGNAVTDDTITITPTLGKVGNVDDNKGGTYTAVYTAPSIMEDEIDIITITSNVLNKETTLSVTLQKPLCEVTITVPDELTVSTDDNVSTTEIIVTVKCGEESVKDEVVEFEVDMGTVGDVINHNNGTYTAVYTAPKTTGTDTITAMAKNSGASKSGDIILIPALPTSMELSANPDTLTADGISQSTLTAILKDANGNPVDDAEVTFSITSGDGNLGETENKGEGRYTAVYTAPEADEESEVIITATVNKLSDSTTIYLEPETVLAALVVSGNVLEADEKTPVPDGINVNVNIVYHSVSENALTEDGEYEVKFTNLSQDLAVGDIIRVIVKSADGSVNYGFSEIHELTETDLAAKKLALNVITERTSIFTISGKITQADGVTPIPSARVSARDKETQSEADGSYALEFTDYATNPVNGEKINLSVSPKAGIDKEIVIATELSKRQMEVNISVDITPPEANAGDDKVVQPGVTIFLDGSKSTDNAQIAKYRWDFDDSDGIGEDATGVEAQTSYDNEGEYVITLTVADMEGNTDTNTLTVTVDGKAIIEAVEVEGSPAKADESIKITVLAEPGGQARFSIAGVDTAADLLMTEVTSGQYVGEYIAQAGDNVTDANVTLHFTDKAGNETDDTSRKATIDTEPPRPLRLEYPNPINPDNVKSVFISGKADNNASVEVKLEDEYKKSINQTTFADAEGNFGVTFDASALKDGSIIITVTEGVDAAGNEPIPATASTSKAIVLGPDFGLSSPHPNVESVPGAKVAYFIIVTGLNGFDKPVHLLADGLSKGVEAEFNPQDVNLTQEEPSQISQLTVTISPDIDTGKYNFKVIGISEEMGTSRAVGLTLTIKKLSTVISLMLEPNPVNLNGQLRAHGQLLLLEGTDERQSLEINLSYKWLQDGELYEQLAPAEKSAEGVYDYNAEFKPDKMGDWEVTASFKGDEKLEPASRTMPFKVIKRDSAISLKVPEETKIVGDTIYISGQLEPNLDGLEISLYVLAPDKSAGDIIRLTTDLGAFDHKLELKTSGAWEIKAKWEGNEQSNPSETETTVIKVIKPVPKFIVVQGGGDEEENEAWEVFNGIVTDVYKTLQNRDFSDDDIYFLSPAKNPRETVNVKVRAKTSRENLEDAITEWAKPQVSSRIPLYIYLLSHNIGDEFLLVKEGGRKDFLTPDMLDGWLAPLEEETGAKATILIEACYSGAFIRDKDGNNTVLPKNGRTIITSARNDTVARAQKRHSFSYHLFSYIRRDFTIKDAFYRTEELMRQQSPWLDANGNGQHGEEADYAMIEEVYIPYQLGTDFPDLPDIYDISGEQILAGGRKEAKLWAVVSGAGIAGVWALIVPPGALDADEQFTSWQDLKLPEIELFDEDGDGIYENTYDNFTESGKYTIIVQAENIEGYTGDAVQTTVTVLPPWYLNGDMEVDISDLAIVGSHLGEATPECDVNGDGKVDLADLLIVGNHFGEKYK